MYMGRNREVLQKTLERRQHEDAAPRLKAEVPRLSTLDLRLKDAGGGMMSEDSEHVRHVVVERAPALFEVRCGDRDCKDGGHDLTWEVLKALRASQARFEGEHGCNGSIGADGAGRCVRVLKYVGNATYSE